MKEITSNKMTKKICKGCFREFIPRKRVYCEKCRTEAITGIISDYKPHDWKILPYQEKYENIANDIVNAKVKAIDDWLNNPHIFDINYCQTPKGEIDKNDSLKAKIKFDGNVHRISMESENRNVIPEAKSNEDFLSMYKSINNSWKGENPAGKIELIHSGDNPKDVCESVRGYHFDEFYFDKIPITYKEINFRNKKEKLERIVPSTRTRRRNKKPFSVIKHWLCSTRLSKKHRRRPSK